MHSSGGFCFVSSFLLYQGDFADHRLAFLCLHIYFVSSVLHVLIFALLRMPHRLRAQSGIQGSALTERSFLGLSSSSHMGSAHGGSRRGKKELSLSAVLFYLKQKPPRLDRNQPTSAPPTISEAKEHGSRPFLPSFPHTPLSWFVTSSPLHGHP